MLSVEVTQEALRPLIRSANSVVITSDTRPILRNLLLTATDEGLEIVSSDMTVNMWLFIPVGDDLTVTGEGRVVVPAFDLMQVTGAIKGGKLSIIATPSDCRVEAPGVKFSLLIEDAKDYPNIHRFSLRQPFITVPCKQLREMLDRTTYCAHTERSFYLMHGLLVKADQGKLTMVSTNGQRLGVCTGDYSKASAPLDEFSKEIVVPADLVPAFKRVLGEDDESVDIQWMARALNVRGPRGEVSLLGLNGNFPDYRRGVPTNSKFVPLGRLQLIEVFKKTQVFKDAVTPLVLMTLDEDKLILETLVADAGSVKVELQVKWQHPCIKLVVNPQFILQTARIMTGATVVLELEDEMTQTMIKEQRTDLICFCVYAVARR